MPQGLLPFFLNLTKTLVVSLIALLPVIVQGQGTNSKRAYKYFEMAKQQEVGRNFKGAIDYLSRAVSIDPNYTDAYYKLGEYNFLFRKLEKAYANYEKVLQQQPENPKYLMAYSRLASKYIRLGKYEKAKEYAQKFLSLNPSTRLHNDINSSRKIIEVSDFALENMADPLKFDTEILKGPVNNKEQNYYPVLMANNSSMIYTARDSATDENIYESTYSGGRWSEGKPVEVLNSVENEGTCTISADGRTMIFTACEGYYDGRKTFGSCDLFITQKVGGEWQKEQNLGRVVNSRYWETQPSLSADGRMLFFVSDRPGGKGNSDIWFSIREDDGKWSLPQNVGSPINTTGNESAPFLHANGITLYFSSDGHEGFGGYDLYKTDLQAGKWTKPENLGYPLNNYTDQFGLFISADNKKGYYSEEIVEGSKRLSKLATFEVPKRIQPAVATNYIAGYIFNANTKQPIEAEITLIDIKSNKKVSSVRSDSKNGEYLIVLPEGKQYALYVNKKSYLFQSYSFDYTLQVGKNLEKDVLLEPIDKGSVVALNNIFFQSGKYTLEERSKTELDKIVSFLGENPQMKIQIAGHTDDVGSPEDNQMLSQNRAKAVADYLTANGVSTSRLEVRGYGETQPLVSNDSDANRAINRRIEFRIL